MKLSVITLLVSVVLAGCRAHDRSPEEIREQTAHATKEVARDAKAVVQGVVDSVKQQHTININRSSSDDLKTLPGINNAVAQRIIEHRPYDDSFDLVRRHLISNEEYNRISDKISAH